MIETAIIKRPEAIPPSLKAIFKLFLNNIVHLEYLSNCIITQIIQIYYLL